MILMIHGLWLRLTFRFQFLTQIRIYQIDLEHQYTSQRSIPTSSALTRIGVIPRTTKLNNKQEIMAVQYNTKLLTIISMDHLKNKENFPLF